MGTRVLVRKIGVNEEIQLFLSGLKNSEYD
jgi:hypothetical protein